MMVADAGPAAIDPMASRPSSTAPTHLAISSFLIDFLLGLVRWSATQLRSNGSSFAQGRPRKGSYDCDQGAGNSLVPSRRKVDLTEPKLTTSPFWSNAGLSGVNVNSPSRVLF